MFTKTCQLSACQQACSHQVHNSVEASIPATQNVPLSMLYRHVKDCWGTEHLTGLNQLHIWNNLGGINWLQSPQSEHELGARHPAGSDAQAHQGRKMIQKKQRLHTLMHCSMACLILYQLALHSKLHSQNLPYLLQAGTGPADFSKRHSDNSKREPLC